MSSTILVYYDDLIRCITASDINVGHLIDTAGRPVIIGVSGGQGEAEMPGAG
jgi:hypothetical protein